MNLIFPFLFLYKYLPFIQEIHYEPKTIAHPYFNMESHTKIYLNSKPYFILSFLHFHPLHLIIIIVIVINPNSQKKIQYVLEFGLG